MDSLMVGISGSISSEQCVPCSSGTYAANPGSKNCSQCLLGQYQTGRGQTSCQVCAAGKYSNSSGRSACLDCPKKMTSFSGSRGLGECYCLSGFVKDLTQSGTCTDVNECKDVGRCNSFELCVNTDGSFMCTVNRSQGVSVCQNVYPAICSLAGGDLLWVSVHAATAQKSGAVARFSSGNTDVYWAQDNWAQVSCPPSSTPGRASSTIYGSDGQLICAFSIVYTPSTAALTPNSLPLEGGPFLLDFAGWNLVADEGTCQILVGEYSAGFVYLSPTSPTTTMLTAPARSSFGVAALSMQCEGAAANLDLGLFLEFKGPARAFLNNGLPCVQFAPCDLYFSLWTPPCWKQNATDPDLWVYLGNLKSSNDAEVQRLQVCVPLL